MAARTDHFRDPPAGLDEAADDHGPARSARIVGLVRRHGPPAAMTGMALSFLIHMLGGIVAALVTFGAAQAGGAGSGQGAVELAVMTEGELAEIQDAALEAGSAGSPDLPAAVLPTDVPLEVSGGDAMAGLGTDLGEVSTTAGGGDIGAGSLGLDGGGGGGGAASFFGVEARGTRFAYIVDVSGSMAPLPGEKRGRIHILQSELGKSLNALAENAAYVVLLYNDRVYPLGGDVKWTDASDGAKRRAREQIDLIEAMGSTEPVEAFAQVFKMRPRPDAVYFMTDGEFPEIYREKIRMLNGGFRIPIHCISFVSQAGAEIMKGIATDSGGTYTYVPGRGG